VTLLDNYRVLMYAGNFDGRCVAALRLASSFTSRPSQTKSVSHVVSSLAAGKALHACIVRTPLTRSLHSFARSSCNQLGIARTLRGLPFSSSAAFNSAKRCVWRMHGEPAGMAPPVPFGFARTEVPTLHPLLQVSFRAQEH
jgi:hypothetical protein